MKPEFKKLDDAVEILQTVDDVSFWASPRLLRALELLKSHREDLICFIKKNGKKEN